MPLLVTVNAQEANVGLDFAHIVRNDNGNIGIGSSGGSTDTATYNEMISDFADDRMNALINNFPNITIQVTGVTNTFVITGTGDPTVDGHPITDFAGITSAPSSINGAGTGANPGSTITITYDTTGCGGSGYCCYDTGGNSISFPTDVLLFHELAHAFHWANNDFDTMNPEPQAENDENQLRVLEGITQRDPNNHGGGCGTCPHGPKNGCLIVTAAYGSPSAPEVEEFRRLRDKLVRSSVWGDDFFARLHAAYYRFSGDVSAAMYESQPLRTSVAALVVQPLTAYMHVVKDYLRGGWSEETFAARIAPRLKGPWADAAIIARHLDALLHGDASPGDTVPPTGAAASEVIRVLDYLFASIVTVGALTNRVRWGLIEPVATYWRVVALGDPGAAALLHAIDDWLARCPISTDIGYDTAEVAAEDLALLRLVVFMQPGVRHNFGQRLFRTLQDVVDYDLRHILEEFDFLPPAVNDGGANGYH